MAVIEYDTRPGLSVDEKMQSLMASIQLALNERPGSDNAGLGTIAEMSRNDLKKAIDVQIKARDQEKYPVGCIEFNVTGRNPADYLGFGTWEAWGSGRVPVGVDANDPDFNQAEHTDGSKDAVVVSHSHDLEDHVHSLANHTHGMSHGHSFSGSTGDGGAHSHGTGSATLNYFLTAQATSMTRRLVGNGGTSLGYIWTTDSKDDSSAVGAGTTTDMAPSHSHTVSGSVGASSSSTTGSASGNTGSGGAGTTASEGVAKNGKNLQPYITCYMFKRTA